MLGDVPSPELADEADRLVELLESHVGRRPAIAEDRLVQRLAAADAEPEAAGQQRRGCRGCLRDDRATLSPMTIAKPDFIEGIVRKAYATNPALIEKVRPAYSGK